MKNIKNEKRLGLFAPDYEIITGRAKKKKTSGISGYS